MIADAIHVKKDATECRYILDELTAKTAYRSSYDGNFDSNFSRRVMDSTRAYLAADFRLSNSAETHTDVTFVDRAQELANLGEVDDAIDLIFDTADDMMCEGRFKELDLILSRLNVRVLSLDVILAILTITWPAKVKLPSRAQFYRACVAELKTRENYRESLIIGLE